MSFASSQASDNLEVQYGVLRFKPAQQAQKPLSAQPENVRLLQNTCKPFIDRYRRAYRRASSMECEPCCDRIERTLSLLQKRNRKNVNTIRNYFERLLDMWTPPIDENIFEELKNTLRSGQFESIIGCSRQDTKRHFGPFTN